MKKILFILLTYNIIFSSPVTLDKANKVAKNIILERFDNSNSVNLTISSTEIIQPDNIDLIYIFHLDPVGFILVPADDRATPVLAYSFENNFIRENMPENLSYLMNQYQSSILEAKETNQAADNQILELWTKYISGNNLNDNVRNVDPLITASFDQECGWNEYCPDDPLGPCSHALVGCVAVAMAQIMHYWGWPETGIGTHGYTSPYGWLEADFTAIHFDFDAMGGGENATDAAAFFLSIAGIAVNMWYGPDESVASYYDAFIAMQNYFYYKNDMNEIYSGQYTDEEWKELLINELESYRPIYYFGNESGEAVGHAWNIDGYNGDLFHMNWGWGGDSNGYFSLDSHDYTEGQTAYINIEPVDINEPRLTLESYESYEYDGDMDMVINPGERFELFATCSIPQIFNDAENITLFLTTEESGINIIIDSYIHGPHLSGESFSNENEPFQIQTGSEITLGEKTFLLNAITESDEGSYEFSYELEVFVSINQFGFPMYEASQKTSLLSVDLDNDGDEEIIFGDYNGFIHILNSDGTEVVNETFPFDTGNQIWGAMAAADMDLDGLTDIAAVSKSKHFYLLDINGLKVDFDSGMYLLGTPAIGNLDGDEDLEVVFGSYGTPTSGNMIWALNPDGSDVAGFPIDLGEKVKIGVALADFNDNGKDDIVVGTDSDYIHLFYDDGTEAPGFPYQVGDKVQSAPSILDVDGQKVIFTGANNNTMYAINSDGSLRFSTATTNRVLNSPAFLDNNNTFYVFFSDDSGVLYAVDTDGNTLSGWPVDAGEVIAKSVAFSDLDNDGTAEIIAVTELTDVLAYNLDGSHHEGFPMNNEFPFTAAPMVMDMDGDGDLEILASSVNSVVALDVKIPGNSSGYWNMYRGNDQRTGYWTIETDLEVEGCTNPAACNYNADATMDDGSCTGPSLCDDGVTLECDFNDCPDSCDLGDVNCDGEFNVLDIVLAANIVLANEYDELADVNGDGQLNILDLVTLVNIILSS